MLRRWLLLAGCIQGFGCAPQSTPRPSAPAAPPPAVPPPPQEAAATPAVSAPVTRLPIAFRAAPSAMVSADQAPHLEIQEPIVGKRIPSQRALDTMIRLKVGRWSETYDVVLALDDFTPRVFDDPGEPIRLGDLVPENRELELGAHRLFAATERADGSTLHLPEPRSLSPFAFVVFWVGPNESSEASQGSLSMAAFQAPLITLLSPRGTFNGEQAAERVRLDFHVLGARVGPGAFRVKATVQANNEAHETLLVSSDVMDVIGLPSGDHTIRVSLIAPDGTPSEAPFATARRTITVNRDAPVE